jgi:hypothetical protein
MFYLVGLFGHRLSLNAIHLSLSGLQHPHPGIPPVVRHASPHRRKRGTPYHQSFAHSSTGPCRFFGQDGSGDRMCSATGLPLIVQFTAPTPHGEAESCSAQMQSWHIALRARRSSVGTALAVQPQLTGTPPLQWSRYRR